MPNTIATNFEKRVLFVVIDFRYKLENIFEKVKKEIDFLNNVSE